MYRLEVEKKVIIDVVTDDSVTGNYNTSIVTDDNKFEGGKSFVGKLS